jgi:hypothetical protein
MEGLAAVVLPKALLVQELEHLLNEGTVAGLT